MGAAHDGVRPLTPRVSLRDAGRAPALNAGRFRSSKLRTSCPADGAVRSAPSRRHERRDRPCQTSPSWAPSADGTQRSDRAPQLSPCCMCASLPEPFSCGRMAPTAPRGHGPRHATSGGARGPCPAPDLAGERDPNGLGGARMCRGHRERGPTHGLSCCSLANPARLGSFELSLTAADPEWTCRVAARRAQVRAARSMPRGSRRCARGSANFAIAFSASGRRTR
jgi:hypothetical protein